MWKSYWTRVRLPPSPPKNKITAFAVILFFDLGLEESKRRIRKMSSGHFSRRGSPTPDVIRTRIERNQTANAVILFFDLGLEKLKSLFSTT